MTGNTCIDCKVTIHRTSIRCIICRNRMIAKNNIGKKSKLYKGENASYKTKHQKINYFYGKANKCEMDDCWGYSNFYEWGNLSGKYLRDRSDWKMMCHSCNQRMDYERKYGNKCKKGHEYTKENTRITKDGKRQCRQCKRKVNK